MNRPARATSWMGSCWYCLTEPAYWGTSTLLLLAQSLQVCFIEFSLDVFQFTALPGQRSYFSRLSAFRPSSFIFALSVDIKSTALGEDTIWIWMRRHALLPYYMKTRTKRAALQNGFKKRYRIAAKRLAAAVANFGCSGQRNEAVWKR